MNDGLETQVVISLELVLQKYEHLSDLADQLLANNDPLTIMSDALIEMKQERESIEKLTADNQPVNQRYRESRPHASPAVNQLTETIGQLMQGLLMKISKLERTAQTAQDKLVPQIHLGVRAVQMKNAYGNVS